MTKGSPLLPEQPKRHRVYRGLSDRQEHIFTWLAVIVVLLFVTAWVAALKQARDERDAEAAEAKAAGVPAPQRIAPSPTREITTAILDADAPSTAYINDAMLEFLDPLRGYSGSLRFTTQTPGSTIVPGAPEPASAVLSGRNGSETTDFVAPATPGVYSLAVKVNQEIGRAHV